MPPHIPIERILAELPVELKRLVQAQFPAEPAAPNSSFSWKEWETWFADAPGRLVHMIAEDYRDYDDRDGEGIKDANLAWSVLDEQYQAIARRCVSLIEKELGKARFLSMKDILSIVSPSHYKADNPGFEDGLPARLLNPDLVLHAFHRTNIAWWRVPARLVLLEYLSVQGDGDAQFAIALVVLEDA